MTPKQVDSLTLFNQWLVNLLVQTFEMQINRATIYCRSSQQQNLLRIALISAFDLMRHPENITKKVGFLQIKLRKDALELPLRLQFDIVTGSVMTAEAFETHEDEAHRRLERCMENGT
jgi:hypothetical protein